MAVEPLFWASMADIKSNLRLTGAAASDAVSLIDQAVEEVRVEFYYRLTKSRVDVLLALPYAENPDTDNETLRALCNAVELKWVKLKLLDRMPTLFMDAAGLQNEVWNTEAAFRQTGPSERERERTRLRKEVEAGLDILKGEEGHGETKSVKVKVFSPDSVTKPGGSLGSDLIS